MYFRDAKVGDVVYIFLTASKTVAYCKTTGGYTLPTTIVAQDPIKHITTLGWKLGETLPVVTGSKYNLTTKEIELGFTTIQKYIDNCECSMNDICMHDCCKGK